MIIFGKEIYNMQMNLKGGEKLETKERTEKSLKLLINQSKEGVDLPTEVECTLVPTIIPNDLAYYIIQTAGCSAFAVYYVLYSNKGEEYNDCMMSMNEICDKTLLSDRTIQKNLSCLVELGLLKIKTGCKSYKNTYFFPYQTAEYTEEQLNEISKIKRKNTKKSM